MIFVCVVFLAPLNVYAARIASIEVKGNESVSEETIRAVIKSRAGIEFNADRVARDIKTLYDLGHFQDIQVEKKGASGGVVLTYQVSEKPRIDSIEIEGNKEIDDDDLKEDISVKRFDIADLSAINDSTQKMKERYASKGYHLVSIKHRFDPASGRNKKLVFVVEEKGGLKVKRINFAGNKAFSDTDLKKVIRTREKGYLSWLTSSGKYQKDILERDMLFLTFHYLNNGYIKVKVGKPRVYLTRSREWLYIDFTVEEGEQYKIRSVDIEGDILTTKGELLDRIKTRAGQIYSRRQIEEDISMLAEMYGDEAYAFASINPQTIPDDEKLAADIVFQISKGRKIKIEQINIRGNAITRDKVIRRELEIVEDGYYSESRLQRSRQNLMALGYFEEVNFATPRGSSDDTVILNIRVKEKPTGSFSVGVGFSSVESFVFTASVAKENVLGYGISGRFSLQMSSRQQLFMFSFQDPYFLDSDWILGYSAYRYVSVYDDFDRSSFGGGVSLGRRVFDYSRVHLGYSIEDVRATDFKTTIPTAFKDNLSGLTSGLSLTLSRDTRDNRLYPSKGSYISVSQEFAGAGGDNQFYRVVGNARYYQPLFWKIVLKQNSAIGYINSLSSLPVPLFERFFTGGVNSLRGYQINSLGPSVRVVGEPEGSDSEFVIGGNKYLLFNVEFELPIFEPAGLKFVTFYDTGDAFGEDENFDLSSFRHDYGFGLRWNSPFGPMRFEWGIPIKRRVGEDPVVFNFTIGSFF